MPILELIKDVTRQHGPAEVTQQSSREDEEGDLAMCDRWEILMMHSSRARDGDTQKIMYGLAVIYVDDI